MLFCVLMALKTPQKKSPSAKINPIAQGNSIVGFSVAQRESVINIKMRNTFVTYLTHPFLIYQPF